MLVKQLNTRFLRAKVSLVQDTGRNMGVIRVVKIVTLEKVAVQAFLAQLLDVLHQLIPSSRRHSVPLMVMIGMMLPQLTGGLFHTTWSLNVEQLV